MRSPWLAALVMAICMMAGCGGSNHTDITASDPLLYGTLEAGDAFGIGVLLKSDKPRTVHSAPIHPRVPMQLALYKYIDLGMLDGYVNSEASGINDIGQVVGSAWREYDENFPWGEAFLWQEGQMHGLGLLDPWGEYSRGRAINNLGQIVGEGDNPSFHSFLSAADGTLQDLYLNNGNESTAYDINDLGQVVGFSLKYYFPQAYIWEEGLETELGEEYGESYAFAINNKGQVVGSRIPMSGTDEYGQPMLSGLTAFLWENALVTDLDLAGAATDINEEGQIVGFIKDQNRGERAFLWEDRTVTELGDLGGEDSRAEAINDAGQIIGASRLPGPDALSPGHYSATLWERGRVRDLNQLTDSDGAHLQWAKDINNHGQIVGRALAGETAHAFLLFPRWQGLVTTNANFTTTMVMGTTLFFDYWADLLPGSGHFVLDILAMDSAGNWSLLGQLEERKPSAGWKTAWLRVPGSLRGTATQLRLQCSASRVDDDPMIFVKDFRQRKLSP
jgi:probable HAF family extracellular repeat protein